MYLKLTTPWNPGQNDPGNTYSTIFITQMTDNRTGGNFQFIYEAGNFASITDATGNTASAWQKGPGMLSQMATVSGADYTAATLATPIKATDSAYASIMRILYTKLINAGFAGTIVDT